MSNSIGVSTSTAGTSLQCMNSPTLAHLPSILNSISCMSQILALLDSCQLCVENSGKFLEVARHQQCLHQGNGIIVHYCVQYMSLFILYVHYRKGLRLFCRGIATVRHKDCNLHLPPDSACIRCAKCISSLQIQAK